MLRTHKLPVMSEQCHSVAVSEWRSVPVYKLECFPRARPGAIGDYRSTSPTFRADILTTVGPETDAHPHLALLDWCHGSNGLSRRKRTCTRLRHCPHLGKCGMPSAKQLSFFSCDCGWQLL